MSSQAPANERTGVVIVTGGAHGIGAAYAKRLVQDGWAVAVADLDEAGAEDCANALVKDGGQALGARADISVEEDVVNFVDRVEEDLGPIVGLVNNAAVFSVVPMSRAPFTEITADEWDLMMRVNVRGTWQMSKAVVPMMASRSYGKIVNVSSGTALKGSTSRMHYVASKAAILGLTKSLAREVGSHGIRVNCVAPGSTLSEEDPNPEMLAHRAAGASDRAISRVQVPSDLAGAVSFLLSEDSDFITGQTLVVDGGSFMH